MNRSTKVHLDRIAELLWRHQASLFVGAGFSKNALVKPGGKLPPDWNQLGDLFIARVRGHEADSSDRAYASVLRLAEEVEIQHGRAALNKIIKIAVNDDMLEPSIAHDKLMALPWNDVYTTNYDTLLERSADRLGRQDKRGYTIITNSADVGTGSSPLLMKLHGDINIPRSVIITEEDYRTYPVKHQAMISSIQNTIMRGTLILIGFSGNDPNFLQWLGWVKDALKSNQRPVYLLSLDDLPSATRNTFKKKKVVVVDIKHFAGTGASDSESVEAVLDYLLNSRSRQETGRAEYWRKVIGWGRIPYRDLSADALYEQWRKDRDTYPGWLALPRNKREYWANSEGFSLSAKTVSKLEKGVDILFVDLFNWRIEKCLFPVDNDWEGIYLQVIANNGPFSAECPVEIRTAGVNLELSLLRLYRQEGWNDKWGSMAADLLSQMGIMTDDQRCRFEYEKALHAVYSNDFPLLEDVLNNWEDAREDFYWDIRRGSLWAEYLSLNKGMAICKKAFGRISARLEAAAEERECFYWASRKVHAHTVIECMSKADFSDGEDDLKSAEKTWLDLRSYEDIWYEREFFESHLRPIEDALRVSTTTASFRLGYSSTATNIGGNSKDYRVAYAFFMYYEEIGYPVHLPYLSTIDKSSLQKALSVMAYCSPPIAECWLLRSGDSKMVKSVYNRRFLERTPSRNVDLLYRRYQACLCDLLKVEGSGASPSWMLAFRAVLPEILSRLCMKASAEARLGTMELVDSIFRSPDAMRYEGLDNLLQSLMSSFTVEETTNLIPRLAAMSIAVDRFGDGRLEPLGYVQKPEKLLASVSSTVDMLLESFGKSRNEDKVILYRLLFLYECGGLSENQQERLSELLWAKRDASGFPDGTLFNRFAFLSFPHPGDVDPQPLLKTYFRSQEFPAMGKDKSISIYGGVIPIFNDIKGTTNDNISFSWDAPLLNDICKKAIDMWDADKGHLLEDEKPGKIFPVADELRSRFKDLGRIVVSVFAPNFSMLCPDNQSGLVRVTEEFEKYSIPSFRMRVALSEFLDGEIDFGTEIINRLSSSEDSYVVDCIGAVKYLFIKGEDVTEYVKLMSDFFLCDSGSGRIHIIEVLGYFVENSFAGVQSVRDNLLLGLKRLFLTTEVVGTDEELTVNEKMYLRMSVAMIVKGLSKEKSLEQNEVLAAWRRYYESDETCWDIKNQFAG